MPQLNENEQTEEYIKKVCSFIKWKEVHPDVFQELHNHLEDQKYKYRNEGMEEEEAGKKAVESMGDAALVGQELNRVHRPKMEWSIFTSIGIMVLIGFVIQFIIRNQTMEADNGNWIMNRLMILFAAGTVFAAAYFWGIKIIFKYIFVLYGIYIAAFWVITRTEMSYNGRSLYSYYMMLLFFPLFVGLLFKLKKNWYHGLVLLLFFYGIVMLFCLQRNAGAAMMELTIGTVVLLNIAVFQKWIEVNRGIGLLLANSPLILALINLIFSLNGYHYYAVRFKAMLGNLLRLNEYFTPEKNFLSYHIDGMLKGSKMLGAAQIPDGVSYLFAAKGIKWEKDYIISYVIVKFGYLAGLLLIASIVFLLVRMFIATRKIKNEEKRVMALACSLVITMESAFYIIGNLYVLVIGTVTLPFLSYGGTSLVINMAIVGLMLSAYRHKEIREREIKSINATE